MDVDNMQAVIDAARKGHDLVTLESDDHFQIIYTPSHGVQTVSLEKHNAKPARKTGVVTVFDPASLRIGLTMSRNSVTGIGGCSCPLLIASEK